MTVDCILDATAHILVNAGFHKLTTNAIAELAGVSIGSLYQYFPNKASLICAVWQRHQEKMARVIGLNMAEHFDICSFGSVQKLVESMIKVHLVEPELHRRLYELQQTGELSGDDRTAASDHIDDYLVRTLRDHKTQFCIADEESAAFLLVHAVRAMIHAAIKKDASPAHMNQIVPEISRILYGYIHCCSC